ncbi:MAG: hypothetical protein ACLQDQ_19660 [Myxococcaceae bacterium]
MDSFVRRLVERLLAEEGPLSRNRHFHTFDTPEGRTALRLARRLKALQRDVLRCLAEGGRLELRRRTDTLPARALELCLFHRVGTHRAFLGREELELLRGLPGLAEPLGPAAARRAG